MIFENLDLAEADSWLTNLLMYFQPQSHSISGEWTIVGFDMVAAWASPGPLPCPECGCRALQYPQGGCHTQDKAVLLQAQALPAHCQNFKYLSSAANHGRKKNPIIINYTALLNSRQLFAKKRIIQFPLDPDENLHTNTCRTEQNVVCTWVHSHMCLSEHSDFIGSDFILNVRKFTS